MSQGVSEVSGDRFLVLEVGVEKLNLLITQRYSFRRQRKTLDWLFRYLLGTSTARAFVSAALGLKSYQRRPSINMTSIYPFSVWQASKIRAAGNCPRGHITDRDLDIVDAILRHRFCPASQMVRLVLCRRVPGPGS